MTRKTQMSLHGPNKQDHWEQHFFSDTELISLHYLKMENPPLCVADSPGAATSLVDPMGLGLPPGFHVGKLCHTWGIGTVQRAQ